LVERLQRARGAPGGRPVSAVLSIGVDNTETPPPQPAAPAARRAVARAAGATGCGGGVSVSSTPIGRSALTGPPLE